MQIPGLATADTAAVGFLLLGHLDHTQLPKNHNLCPNTQSRCPLIHLGFFAEDPKKG